eukprot:CAMPEP_0203652266 /NCGR_PEP_ID=MMETSP0088-20131115/29680_1 /ASSEMBLY_ACC=CAM_ASM_001087 /TAXON_ID=426623 /ORGANISM="Chaetoceros affinis, Strain CCMP159" /LENGTH=46 /DNA_ID= /DNA_START= /DNA_END= /DNA_ORIENTATION=
MIDPIRVTLVIPTGIAIAATDAAAFIVETADQPIQWHAHVVIEFEY